jgi:metal-sulfur cluster biosynthetic enzyme
MADPSQPPGQDAGTSTAGATSSTGSSTGSSSASFPGPPAEQVNTGGGSLGGPQERADGHDSGQAPASEGAAGQPADGGSGSPPSEEDVLDALSNVIDPELGLDFVELGLIYGVELTAGDVRVTFTLTTPACPIGPHVTEQIEEFVGELEGVTSVSAEMVFIPPWSPERMSEDAKFALGF